MNYQRRRSLKKYENKQFQDFLDKLKTNLNNENKLKELLNSEEASNIIKLLLEKKLKNQEEIFILELYLTKLKNFADLLKQEENHKNIDYIIHKLIKDLKTKNINKNCFLMKIGEIGKEFFITISGKIVVLIPKIFEVKMTTSQFLKHLNFLYSYHEEYLYRKTINENLSKININLTEIEKPLENIDLNNIEYESYISKINCQNIRSESTIDDLDIENEKSIQKKIYKIVGYFKVCELNNGSSFGEIALINVKNKRTASIFVKENSVFGVLSSDSYNKCIRGLHEKLKKENLNYIHNTSIFRKLSKTFFFGKFWNCFVERKIKKNEYIFKQGFNRDEFYFIKSGEIKIIINNCSYELVNKYISNLINKRIYSTNHNKKTMNLTISYYREGEVIGMDDLIYDNKLICSGICNSEKLVFFALNIKFLHSIFKNNSFALEYFKKIENNKKEIICQRLFNIKKTFENSIQGKSLRNSSVEDKQIEEIKNYFNYSLIEKKEKKPIKIKHSTNLGKINLNIGKNNNNNYKILNTTTFRPSMAKIKEESFFQEKKNFSNINKINYPLDKFNFLNNYTNSRNKTLSLLDKSNSNNSNKIYYSFTKEYNNNFNSKNKIKNKKPIKLILKNNKNNGLYSPTYKKMEKGVMNVVLYKTTRQIQISRISLSQNIYDNSSKFLNFSHNYDDEIMKKDEFENKLRKKSCSKISKKNIRESYIVRTKTNSLNKRKKDIFHNFNPKLKKKNSLNLVSFDSLL